MRGVTKEGGGGDSQEPTYFVLEAAPLDRFLRKNREEKNFSSIERVFVSSDEDDGNIDSLKAERMSRKEVSVFLDIIVYPCLCLIACAVQ